MESVIKVQALEAIISEFNDLFKNPEIYVEPQHENSKRFKLLTKNLYEYMVASNSLSGLRTKSLAKLLIDGFDEEQIWQQIEIQNKSALPYLSEAVSSINEEDLWLNIHQSTLESPRVASKNKHPYNDSSAEEASAFDDDSDSCTDFVSKNRCKEEYIFDDDSDSYSEFQTVNGKKAKEEYGVGDYADSSNEEEKSVKKRPVSTKKSFLSKVDDQFFKLSHLEEFLKIEDLKEEKKDLIKSDDEDIDLFQDIPSEDEEINEESEEEGKMKKSSKDLIYEDFFDAPESGDESINDTEDINDPEGILNKKDETSGHSESNSDEEMEEDMESEDDLKRKIDSVDNRGIEKTPFQLEQEKIEKKIEEYEKNMLEPLPWHLTGEVAASSRPEDSLLRQDTDFEASAKLDFTVETEANKKLDSLLDLGILNKAFWDVDRKWKPTEEIISYKKEVALDQTKNKKSLAEVYEEDYLKKQSKQKEEKEDPKHTEIKKLMDSLFPELHALFSHIPKPAVPEIKIVSNLPAITVEEVAPTSVSDATLLAPEEVKVRSGLIKGHTERTDTDRKRERRKKKLLQKVKAKKKEEKLKSQKGNPSSKTTKQEKLGILKKLKQYKNTKIANVDEGGKIKSSKDFFSRLQDTVDSKKKTNHQVQKVKK